MLRCLPLYRDAVQRSPRGRTSGRRASRRRALGWVLLIAGCLALPCCAVERPLVDNVLGPASPLPGPDEASAFDAAPTGSHAPPGPEARQLAIDRVARAARQLASASPERPQAQIEASWAL